MKDLHQAVNPAVCSWASNVISFARKGHSFHIPSTVRTAEHSVSPALLMARTVYSPESSGKASAMMRELCPSSPGTIWKMSSDLIGLFWWYHTRVASGKLLTWQLKRAVSPSLMVRSWMGTRNSGCVSSGRAIWNTSRTVQYDCFPLGVGGEEPSTGLKVNNNLFERLAWLTEQFNLKNMYQRKKKALVLKCKSTCFKMQLLLLVCL